MSGIEYRPPTEGGGGTQLGPLTLLGPYPVAFDTPGVVNPINGLGLQVGDDLPAGSVVIAAWFHNTQTWAAPDGFDSHDINLVDAADNGQLVANLVADNVSPVEIVLYKKPDGPNTPLLCVGDCRLTVAVWPTGGDPTAGASDVYAFAYVAS